MRSLYQPNIFMNRLRKNIRIVRHGDRQAPDIPRYIRNNLHVERANKYLKRIVKSRKNAIP